MTGGRPQCIEQFYVVADALVGENSGAGWIARSGAMSSLAQAVCGVGKVNCPLQGSIEERKQKDGKKS